MLIKHIISAIEEFAPLALQEKWDNTGLQVGDPSAECSGVLLCLDVSESVVATLWCHIIRCSFAV